MHEKKLQEFVSKKHQAASQSNVSVKITTELDRPCGLTS
jgi:hypothetical protein